MNPLIIDDLIKRADSSIINVQSSEIEPIINHSLDSLELQVKKLLMELTIDFWNGGYRDLSYYQNLFPLMNVEEAIHQLSEKLDNSGLPQFDFKIHYLGPDPEFVIACNLICDFNDKRGVASKLKDIDKTTRHWNAWLNKQANRDFLQDRMEKVWDSNTELNAKLGLSRLIESGDLSAIKFFYEVTHKYRPQDAQIANMNLMMVTLMEVLAKFVSTDILAKIADEIDQRKIGELTK